MIEDRQLRQDVFDELCFDPRVDATHIALTAVGGVVTLSGRVRSFSQARGAARAALRVPGVHAVANELISSLEPATGSEDVTIARALAAMLDAARRESDGRVQGEVHRGVVALRGRVDDERHRERIELQARAIAGVRCVENHVRAARSSRDAERRSAGHASARGAEA